MAETRIGRKSASRQGLTLQVKRYVNRENVEVEILETGERKWVTYVDFRKGRVYADFSQHPYNHDVTLGVAKFFTLSIAGLIAAIIGGAIYAIL